jgi:hypothetical protein
MAIGTYAELLTAAANWLARDDLTDRIPEFITLTEAKLNRALRCTQMETRATATVDTDSDEPEFIALPGDFQTMRRLRLSGVTGKPLLECVSQQQADDIRYCLRDVSGQPAYFTLFADEMELIPTPSDDYELEMVYRATIPALSEDQTTNWLLSMAPDVYLYGVLLEAAPYTRDDERVSIWVAGYTAAIDALNSLSTERVQTASPMSVRLEGVAP